MPVHNICEKGEPYETTILILLRTVLHTYATFSRDILSTLIYYGLHESCGMNFQRSPSALFL